MKVFNIISLGLLICLASCSDNKSAEKESYSDLQFRYYNLEKAGWRSKNYTQQIKDIKYSATEVPIQYYILRGRQGANLTEIDSIYQSNKKERVFEFVLQEENEKDLLKGGYTSLDYTKALEYMSFQIQNDFKVVTSKNDTIPCIGAHYERNYNVAPYNKILLYFTDINPNEKLQLLYNDRLFGNGLLKFSFKENLLIL